MPTGLLNAERHDIAVTKNSTDCQCPADSIRGGRVQYIEVFNVMTRKEQRDRIGSNLDSGSECDHARRSS